MGYRKRQLTTILALFGALLMFGCGNSPSSSRDAEPSPQAEVPGIEQTGEIRQILVDWWLDRLEGRYEEACAGMTDLYISKTVAFMRLIQNSGLKLPPGLDDLKIDGCESALDFSKRLEPPPTESEIRRAVSSADVHFYGSRGEVVDLSSDLVHEDALLPRLRFKGESWLVTDDADGKSLPRFERQRDSSPESS